MKSQIWASKGSLDFQDSPAYSLMYLYLGVSGPDPSIEICWGSEITLPGNLVTLTITDLQLQEDQNHLHTVNWGALDFTPCSELVISWFMYAIFFPDHKKGTLQLLNFIDL